jgi:segregation and condensation protein B
LDSQTGNDKHPKDPSARFTLERLSSAFARLMGSPAAPAAPRSLALPTVAVDSDQPLPEDEALPVTPRSIVEGMLFVGRADGRPLTSREMSAHIRNVSPEEVDALVAQLNETYLQDGAAYQIAADGPGYRLQLRPELGRLRERFRGGTRAARLSPAAVEVLSVIAYRQPVTSEEICRLRGAQSQGILQQLVRRQLVRVDRTATPPRTARYHTTERFNAVFGVKSPADLPRDEDLDDS